MVNKSINKVFKLSDNEKVECEITRKFTPESGHFTFQGKCTYQTNNPNELTQRNFYGYPVDDFEKQNPEFIIKRVLETTKATSVKGKKFLPLSEKEADSLIGFFTLSESDIRNTELELKQMKNILKNKRK